MRYQNIYSTYSDLKKELDKRWNDPELRKRVEKFWGKYNFPVSLINPHAFISRSIATPNLEFKYFHDLASDLELNPLVLEYDGKLVTKNPEKYHLCKLLFYKNKNDLHHGQLSVRNIVDINKNQGQYMFDISTLWGENLRDFHHRILESKYAKSDSWIIDVTDWFNKTRYETKFYYMFFLSLFICHGVLFDNYLLGDEDEYSFFIEKVEPSFNELETFFGVKPLIFPLVPIEDEKHLNWSSYDESLLTFIPQEINAKI